MNSDHNSCGEKNLRIIRKVEEFNKIIKQIHYKFKDLNRKTIKLETVYVMIKIHMFPLKIHLFFNNSH